MPKITQIKAQLKSKERVSVFLDGKYAFSLTLSQLLDEKLKKDSQLEESDVKRLKRLSDEGKLKVRAVEWLLNRPRSVREFRDYAFKKPIEKDVLESWIEEFIDKRYLDDKAFAHWYAENRARKYKSRRAIIAELLRKGITRTVAEDMATKVHTDQQSLKQLVKKLRGRERYKDENKLIRHLLSKGFSYDDIKRTLNPPDSKDIEH